MFKAAQSPGFPLRVYDLVYDGGADHKQYLAFLQREQEVRPRGVPFVLGLGHASACACGAMRARGVLRSACPTAGFRAAHPRQGPHEHPD